MIPAAIKRELSALSLTIHERGWVANHDGNVSIRTGADRILITPTGVSKRFCTPDSLAEVDFEGNKRGRNRPPSETALHIGAYRAREDVRAVLHAHPPHASAFAMLQREIAPVAMPEVLVSLGEQIPLVGLFVPKDPAVADAVGQALQHADATLLAGNGVLTVGPDLETAFLRMELLEHYAQILSVAGQLGAVTPLPAEARARCLDLRKRAGLHRGEAIPRAAPAPEGIREVVADEIRRALGGSK